LFERIGLEPDHFIVADDDGAGVDAARLLWTLEVAGHKNYALLNGGFAAWDDAEYEVSESPSVTKRGNYPVKRFSGGSIVLEEVLKSLHREEICIIDTRSAAEYSGTDVRAKKGGHIPGAIHFDWSSAVDMTEEGALRDPYALQAELEALGVTTEKQVIVYCQSNRRSSHTFIVLKWLGYQDVKAYIGSWSEWGNSKITPVQIQN
jgi:thiosulfate/3-mercaptopyruvate sulfurtransferase